MIKKILSFVMLFIVTFCFANGCKDNEDEQGVLNDENGNPYQFQWERLGIGRSTSIILHGFEKIAINIKPRIIGKVTEEGLKWIEEHVQNYIICDVSIKKAPKQPSN